MGRMLLVDDITARCTGDPAQSRHPGVHESYQRVQGGHDRSGGGAVIPCQYSLCVRQEDLRDVMAIFERYVPRNELYRFRV